MANSKWKWCLHCNQCYLDGEFKIDDDPIAEAFMSLAFRGKPHGPSKVCPYPDCDGSLWGDSWDWDEMRKTRPTWPETPKRGVVYDPYEEHH